MLQSSSVIKRRRNIMQRVFHDGIWMINVIYLPSLYIFSVWITVSLNANSIFHTHNGLIESCSPPRHSRSSSCLLISKIEVIRLERGDPGRERQTESGRREASLSPHAREREKVCHFISNETLNPALIVSILMHPDLWPQTQGHSIM